APVAEAASQAAPVQMAPNDPQSAPAAAVNYPQQAPQAAPVAEAFAPVAEAASQAAPVQMAPNYAQPAPAVNYPQQAPQAAPAQMAYNYAQPVPAPAAPKKKKKMWILWMVLGLVVLLAAAAAAAVWFYLSYQPKEIKLNKTKLTLEMEDSKTLKCEITPSKAKDKSVDWETSDDSVATVSDGKITAVAPGSCTITATTENGKKATCRVEVEPMELTMEAGSDYVIYFEVTSSTAKDDSVEWVSSDEAVAIVYDGEITAVGPGTCTITAETENGTKTVCNVTVEENEYDIAVVGKWECVAIGSYEDGEYYDPSDFGLDMDLTLNEDHTYKLVASGETEYGEWEFLEIDGDDDYMYEADTFYFYYTDYSDEVAIYDTDYAFFFERSY
ncbi:MAG: Ig-like domain-containing protein, partial [Clostridia bacterium]|nr:Ig-like domain-containing protein [Clostridia bacterium]